MAAERTDSARTSRPRARAAVLQTLIDAGAVSRADLARRTGLAPSTVSAVVADLGAEGVVVESAREGGGVGRPSTLLTLHRRAGLAVGIDFGKRHVRVAVADLAHTVIAERAREVEGDLPAAEAVALGAELVHGALDDSGASLGDVVGVGMGLPGPINEATGELGDSMILPGWAGVRPAEVMTSALGMAVEVGNDANLGAMSEWRWGAGQGARDLVYLKVATGVGAGMILDGVPYRGWGGTAGELGHIVIDPRGSICRCGNRGCLETIAGAPAILGALRETHGDDLTIGEAVRRGAEGDAGCRRAIADAGAAIGTAAAAICNLLNPRRIVVGGDVAAAGGLLLEPLREALTRAAIRSAAHDVEVVEGALADRAEVLGAVALVLQRGPDLVTAPLADSA